MPQKEKEIKEELIKKGIIASPKRFILPTVFIILAILASAGTFYYLWLKDQIKNSTVEEITENEIEAPESENFEYKDPFVENEEKINWQKSEFAKLGLSIQVPGDFKVSETIEGGVPTVNIQNYPIGAPPPEVYFKIQITRVENSDPASDIEKIKDELYYPKEKTLGENDFVQGISVDRKLVSLLHKNDVYLKITTTPRNDETEKLTDEILSTIVIK